MDHIKILKRALQITWRYRGLWLIGLLLVLAGGSVIQTAGGSPGGGGSGSGGSGAPEVSGDGEAWEELPENGSEDWAEFWEVVVPIIAIVGILILALILVVVLIGIVRAVLRYLTRTSLIEMTNRYEETGEEVGFWSGLRLGWSASAWRLFLINLILKLPLTCIIMLGVGALVLLAVLSFIGGGPLIALGVMSLLLIIPAGLIAAAVGAILGPVIQIAHRQAVIEKLGAWKAITESVGLIRRHLGAVALQWLLLIGLRIAWGVVMVPVGLVLFMLGLLIGGLPALLVGGLISLLLSWPVGIIIGMLILIPLMFLVIGLPSLALSAAATIYHSVVWTLTFRELQALESDTVLYRAGLDDGSDLLDLEVPEP